MILVDRVKVGVISSGTGPFVLGGPARAFRGVEALTDGQTYAYAVDFANMYEVGEGTFNSAARTLSRTPRLSSNANGLVSFPTDVVLAFTAVAANFAKIVGLTQAEYDALASPDATTLYAIIDA